MRKGASCNNSHGKPSDILQAARQPHVPGRGIGPRRGGGGEAAAPPCARSSVLAPPVAALAGLVPLGQLQRGVWVGAGVGRRGVVGLQPSAPTPMRPRGPGRARRAFSPHPCPCTGRSCTRVHARRTARPGAAAKGPQGDRSTPHAVRTMRHPRPDSPTPWGTRNGRHGPGAGSRGPPRPSRRRSGKPRSTAAGRCGGD